MTLSISQAAEDLIIDEEVGSKATYISKYQHPEWPGGASGITIAIGYDLGYQSRDGIKGDWGGVVASGMVDAMESVDGLKGEAAHEALPRVRRSITITWDQAIMVFDGVDRPRWIEITAKALPNCDKLAPDCVGSLVSITYNRGASYSADGDRYREMRAIRALMISQQFDQIPAQIRSMKRLWNNGLVGRREREAQLFERGLSIMKGVHTEETAPKAQTRTQMVRRSAAKVAGSVGAGTGGTASVAPKPAAVENYSAEYVFGIVLVGVLVGAAIALYFGRHQKLPRAD